MQTLHDTRHACHVHASPPSLGQYSTYSDANLAALGPAGSPHAADGHCLLRATPTLCTHWPRQESRILRPGPGHLALVVVVSSPSTHTRRPRDSTVAVAILPFVYQGDDPNNRTPSQNRPRLGTLQRNISEFIPFHWLPPPSGSASVASLMAPTSTGLSMSEPIALSRPSEVQHEPLVKTDVMQDLASYTILSSRLCASGIFVASALVRDPAFTNTN
jgi:hypothetical protein